jgi:hypothetical protein
MPKRTHTAFIASDDIPEHGVQAGDCFFWEQTSDGARLVQVREWKNPISLLGLLGSGVLEQLPDAPSQPALRLVVGSHPDKTEPFPGPQEE